MAEIQGCSSERPSTPTTFISLWENLFLFMEYEGMAKCLICGKLLQHVKKFNIQCHYSVYHAKDYDKYGGEDRQVLVQQLKDKLSEGGEHTVSESILSLSYRISLAIAKNMRPFTDGEFAKNVAIMTAEELFPSRIQECESISLSPRTVTRRIQDMADDVHDQLKKA